MNDVNSNDTTDTRGATTMAQAHEPLTSERLAEIRAAFARMLDNSERGSMAQQFYHAGMAVLADNERLHAALAAAEAREAALREVAQQVIHPPAGVDLVPVYVTPDAYRQARALLAATEAGEWKGE